MKEQRDLKRMLSRTLVIVVIGCMLFILASTVTADSQYPPNEYRIPLQHQWNLITVPVNVSIAKNQVTIRNNSIDYNFTEAVNHGIIVGTFFGWDRENQTYFIANSRGFEPGKGYWLWAYYPCSLILHSDVRGDGYITRLHSQWNLLGQTYNSSLALTDLHVLYKGTSYSWANATSTNNEEHHQLIIPSVFNWSSSHQSYDLSTGFTPGEGYWIYAYYNCSLRQEIDAPVILDHSADITGTGNSYVCNASVSDSDGVKSVWLEYWYGSGFHSFVEMNPTGVDSYYETILTIPSGSVDSLHYIIAANDTKNYWNTTSEQTVVVTDDDAPTINLNFAGNPSDSGGPYYLPGTNTPAPEGYYTNASYQKEKWIQINCTATDNVGIAKVWLHWLNGTQWTNNTYQLTHTTGNYYKINMSTGIAPGPKYSFDLFTVDTSGNTMLYHWLKAGADTTAVDDRRYVQLGGTPTNISYTPYYFYPAQYNYPTGYGPGHNMTNDDILHHDQGPDGTLTDTGYLLAPLPTNTIQDRNCTMYVGYWFDETVTAQPGTIKNIYHHFWWNTDNNQLTVAYGKSDAGFYRTEGWSQSYLTNIAKTHSSLTYTSKTYYLESALMKITTPQSFTDNDIYEFFVEYYTSNSTNPAVINNRSIQSFVIFNVPDNTTLQGQDTDHDGLTDYQELYVTFTNPFVQDTDNDGVSDYYETVSGSDPNDYKDTINPFPSLSSESPQNQSRGQLLNPQLSITITQYQNHLMNVTFYTNATGSWQTIGTNHSVLNGRYSQTPTTMNKNSTTYYWSVHCNVGSMWTNNTYHFTTWTEPGGWIYYKKITVNHSLVNQSLTNFPILIKITDTDLMNHAQPGARDVQFWDATNTTRYHHEIEKYNDTTGEFIAWVNITYLSATQDTIIWMRYGNTTCGSQENIVGTWDGNYIMVQHLNETGNTLYDSTSYHNNGVSTGTDFTATGEIDGARQYNDSDKIVANTFTHSPTALTAEAWVYRDNTSFIYIFCKGTFSNSSDWILYLRNNQGSNQGIDFGVNNNGIYTRAGDTPVSRWFYVTATYNSGTANLYFNGTQISTRTGLPSIPNNYPNLGMGNDYLGTNGGQNPMTQVKLDELRVSKIARNSSWIKTSYNTMSLPASFLHISAEELFTLISSHIPTQGTPLLISEFGTNTTDEKLICRNQSTVDPNGDTVYNTYHWFKNGTSLVTLLLPFNMVNSTKVKDYSGYKNNGTVTGATWVTSGKIGGAYYLDGTNDYLSIPDASGLDGDGTWTAMTMEFWLKPGKANQTSITIFDKRGSSTSAQSYQIGYSSTTAGRLFVGYYLSGGYAQTSTSTSTPNLYKDQWYHVVSTYKNGEGIKLFVNGSLYASQATASGTIKPSDTIPLIIGKRGADNTRFVNGTIDEVKIYPYALTAQQINQNYNDSKKGYSNASRIVKEETSTNDIWRCEVTPSDGQYEGLTKTSNSLTIVPMYTLTMTKNGNGSGTIEVTPSGPYHSGTIVTLWANASTDSTFTGWSGALSGTTTPETLTMDADKTVNAEFTSQLFF